MPTPLIVLQAVNKSTLNALERAGVDTVEKLCAMTMYEVGKVKGIGGTVGQIELKRALMEMGLTFRGEGQVPLMRNENRSMPSLAISVGVAPPYAQREQRRQCGHEDCNCVLVLNADAVV